MDKNTNHMFDYPFDFERYIEERIREIEDLEERRFAKALLQEGLGKSILSTEERYHALEQRIYDETRIPDNCYEIATTVIEKSCFDPSNDTLYPVCPIDLEEEELRIRLSGETERYVETVFLELSEQELQLVKKEGGFLRPALRYRELVEQLYQIFGDNSVTWNTVNMAYLDKFFDVFLKTDSSAEQPSGESSSTQEDPLLKWGGAVRHGMIPLWNVEKIIFESVSFMTPCPDGNSFEHEFISKKKIKQEGVQKEGYLIQKNDDIMEIRHEKDRIILCSAKSTFYNWVAYRIIQEGPFCSSGYSYPVLANRKRDSFLRRYALKQQRTLMTKVDLFRRITELEIGDYLEVVDYKICEAERSCPYIEGMNWFVRDTLFPLETRKVLQFFFREKNPGYYLNDAIARYVISQLQLEISEYRCAAGFIN